MPVFELESEGKTYEIEAPSLEAGAQAFKAGQAERAQIDTETGAPAEVRALVGGAPTGKDRLKTIRKFFPDARPASILDDIEGHEDNFVYTNPETKKKTLYNPSGPDVGDIPAVAREASQAVGGTAGAIAGAPAGPVGAIAGAGVGTMVGEEAFNLGAQAFGMEDTRTAGERAAGTAISGAMGATGQGLGMGAGALFRGGARQFFRGGEAGRQEVVSAIDDMGKFGASPSLAQATQKPVWDSIEQFIARTPGGAGRIRKMAVATAESVSDALEKRAFRLARTVSVEPELAGRTIERGIGGFTEKFRERAGVLFDKVDEFIPAENPVSVVNTRTALEGLTQKVPGMDKINALLVNPRMASMAEGFADVNNIPYGTLKAMRSEVGKKLSGGSLMDDVPRSEWKHLYAAISRDMESAAGLAGEGAKKAFTRANSFYKAGIGRVNDSLEGIIKNKVPERVFTALESGGRLGPTTIRTLRKSLDPSEWRLVAATVMRRLGKATPGQQGAEGSEFSFNTFLTNWNRLDKGAKVALFNGQGLKGMRGDLDSLARAAQRIRDSSKAFANPSGTAGSMIGQTMMLSSFAGSGTGLMMGSPTAAIAFPAIMGVIATGGNLSARLMTSPRFVRWLAASTRMKPNAFGSHLGRLATTARSADPDTAEAIREYVGVYAQASEESSQESSQESEGGSFETLANRMQKSKK